MARFDRVIPPGGEGKVTLKVVLRGYQGPVKKSAVVFSNDPQAPRTTLTLQGNVKALIDIKPSINVSFRGLPDKITESVVEIATTSEPFNISKSETNLEDKISYEVETLEKGRRYQLKIKNLLKKGNYNGFIKFYTDLAQKPDFLIRVTGTIEGEISVRPLTLIVGRLAAQQPVRLGKVTVSSNRNNSFKINSLAYDEGLLKVTSQPLPNNSGFSLEISPKMENVPSGGKVPTTVVIETDAQPAEKIDLQVHVINNDANTPAPPAGRGTAGYEEDEDNAEAGKDKKATGEADKG